MAGRGLGPRDAGEDGFLARQRMGLGSRRVSGRARPNHEVAAVEIARLESLEGVVEESFGRAARHRVDMNAVVDKARDVPRDAPRDAIRHTTGGRGGISRRCSGIGGAGVSASDIECGARLREPPLAVAVVVLIVAAALAGLFPAQTELVEVVVVLAESALEVVLVFVALALEGVRAASEVAQVVADSAREGLLAALEPAVMLEELALEGFFARSELAGLGTGPGRSVLVAQVVVVVAGLAAAAAVIVVAMVVVAAAVGTSVPITVAVGHCVQETAELRGTKGGGEISFFLFWKKKVCVCGGWCGRLVVVRLESLKEGSKRERRGPKKRKAGPEGGKLLCGQVTLLVQRVPDHRDAHRWMLSCSDACARTP